MLGAARWAFLQESVMDAKLMNLAIAAGIVFAAYKWGNGLVKAGAASIAAVMVAKQIPYVSDYV